LAASDLIAAISFSFCGVSGSASPNCSNASTAIGGSSSVRISTRGGIARATWTFKRIDSACQPRCCSVACSLGSCCLSRAASADDGTASTSTPSWNDSTSQLPNMLGNAPAQSFCRRAIRVAAGRRLARRSFLRRKS
jgi:hypothetical protein